ncbi:MAG: zinc ribbon domain-containing protein [Bacteroidales bacterium]|nr:zinc ribbon domain-containing protein [Bacteroidales bacterium]MCM1415243.1 zinc ribbon domain-containing protein [bacterium]MCM1423267.1 zinc ribbon domain-containing protein [bacterium]
MFCVKCGKQIGDNAKFCPFCGQKVSAAAAAAASGGGETAVGGQKPAENLRKRRLIIAAAFVAVVIVATTAVIAGVRLSASRRAEAEREEERRAERSSEKKKEKSADNAGEKTKEDEAAQAAERTDEADAAREAEQADEENAAAEADALSEEELLNVLSAYQAYVDGLGDAAPDGCVLAYLDEDAIPELIVIGNCEAAGQVIVTYNDGELKENYISRLGGLSYVEKKNFYRNANGHMGFYYDEFCCLENGEQKTLALGEYGDLYDDAGNIVWNEAGDYPEQRYAWNGVDCSEMEYYEKIESYVNQTAGDAEFIHVDTYGSDVYFDMQEAYQNISLRTYGAYWPQVVTFDLTGDVLTFTTDDGARYGWGSGNGDTSTVSYPVAQDCIWENRSVGWENKYPQVGYTEYLKDTTYEEIRKWLDEEKNFYEKTAAEYGEDAAEVNSPFSINLVVKDGVVVRVYTVIS